MKFILSLALGLTLLAPAAMAEDKDVVGVLFYADWCPPCKVLDPKVEEARESLEDTKFYTFDMTDGRTRDRTKEIAKFENIEPVLMHYGAKTGFLVIYDRGNDKIIQRIDATTKPDEIVTAFQTAQND